MTLLSLALIVCTALGVILTAPLTASADTPDYLSWSRAEAKAGDLLANKYVLFDKSQIDGTKRILFDGSADTEYGMLMFCENGLSEEDTEICLVGWANEDDSSVIRMAKYYNDENYAVFYITPFTTNFDEGVTMGTLPLTLTSTLSADVDGMYFISDNGATLPEDGNEGTETPEEETLPSFSGVNYNAVYLNEGDTFDNTAYLCVPETISTGVITFTSNGANIHIITPDNIEYTGDKIEAVAYTNRYGVKAYVYDVSSLPEGLIIKGVAGDVSSVYMLTLKDGAKPEVPQPSTPSNPGDGGNTEDPGDGGFTTAPNEGEPKDFWDKARDFFTKLGEGINENTGVAIGSTGALILFAVVLYLIFRR